MRNIAILEKHLYLNVHFLNIINIKRLHILQPFEEKWLFLNQ